MAEAEETAAPKRAWREEIEDDEGRGVVPQSSIHPDRMKDFLDTSRLVL